MKPEDRELGMGRVISRRDFVQGAVGTIVAGALVPGCRERAPVQPGAVGTAGSPPDAAAYPPSRLGLRGSHPGSFEVAHELALQKRSDWGTSEEPDPGDYDLVVVGAGVSGLAAAYFYREQHPGARVLLLENHDDFGGHARRNEFAWQGRTILGYGGSQSLQEPSSYSEVAKGLLETLGAEPAGLREAYDEDFYRRHGLAAGVFFDHASYGVDRVVRSDFVDPSLFLPVASSGVPAEESIDRMPISEAARQELRRLLGSGDDGLPEQSLLEEPEYLRTISYRSFLVDHLGVREPEVLKLLHDLPSGFFGHGIDAVPALDALGFGLPGMGSTSLGRFEGLIRGGLSLAFEPYLYHFPDGNASVARLLVARLIPEVAAGHGMGEMVTAGFDYGALDRSGAPVRLRLDSTVVRVAHEGEPGRSPVGVTYVRNGRSERVRARRVVLACYNAVIPHLCPELPAPQKEALASLVKIPLVYTNVLLRSWRAFRDLGLALAHCPGSWHKLAMLDFPVSLGDYRFSADPDEPIVLHMSSSLAARGVGPPRAQSRAGRYELLATSFETIEREIRTHLAGMLGGAGFDPARDILGIAVNRWPHGYAFEPSPLFDPRYEPGEAPHEIGRARFGEIAIANSDAGGSAFLDVAIDQAWRAVGELSA